MADIFAGLSIAAAIGALGSAEPFKPVRLEVETQGESSTIRVVAESPVACTAAYALEVSGGAGANRSINRGSVRIMPGESRTVATVKVGPAEALTAKLKVEPCTGLHYQQEWPAPAGS